MNLTIAIEPGLTPYRQYLEEKGYRVVDLDETTLGQADAMVVSGVNHRFMGINDIDTQRRLVLAEGLTPSEVEGRIRFLERVDHMRPDNDGQGR